MKNLNDSFSLKKFYQMLSVVKAFPVGTIHNWNNGPHKKMQDGEWSPLEGEELAAYHKQNPNEAQAKHGDKEKVHGHIKEKAKKQLEESSHPKEEKPKSYKNARIIPKKTFQQVLDMGHFSIISAGRNFVREGGEEHTDDFFRHRTQALKEDLEELGVPFMQVFGKYGTGERSFVVLHDDLDSPEGTEESFMVSHGKKKNQENMMKRVDSLAKKYNQDSVIHAVDGKQAFVRFTTNPEGKMRPDCHAKEENGKVYSDQTEASDYYTKAQHRHEKHTKFSYNLSHCFE